MYRPIGKTRIRLAEMLTRVLGFTVEPEDFWLQDPTHLRHTWDCAAWGAYVKKDGVTQTICSFDPMRLCVRNGFSVIHDHSAGSYADYEVVSQVVPYGKTAKECRKAAGF